MRGAAPQHYPRHSYGTCSSAVTLIEMLAALAILALMVTLVRSALDHSTPRWRLRAAAHQLENAARFALNAAAATGAPAKIYYDVSDNSYWVRRAGDEEPVLAEHELPDGVRFDEVSFADGRSVTNEVAMLRAYDDGTLDFHRIVLTAPGGGRARLTFRRLTGDMQYEEAAEDAEFR